LDEISNKVRLDKLKFLEASKDAKKEPEEQKVTGSLKEFFSGSSSDDSGPSSNDSVSDSKPSHYDMSISRRSSIRNSQKKVTKINRSSSVMLESFYDKKNPSSAIEQVMA
tara:strand:- start:29 stop:358 length:330 start_codon:yes stop_codon:yes gene_type:complete